MTVRGSTVGLVIGAALGFAGAFGGLEAFVIVLALAVVGFLAGKVYDGDIDLTVYLGGRRRRSDR